MMEPVSVTYTMMYDISIYTLPAQLLYVGGKDMYRSRILIITVKRAHTISLCFWYRDLKWK